MSSDFESGKVLLVDKPKDWTSFDVVKKLRHAIRIKKIGHAGTLDPMATGLLILCTGKFTKKIDEFMGAEKEYEGTLVLGATTPSYDAESEIDATFPWEHITEEDLKNQAKAMTGDIAQMPPIFSALKVGGKRAYDLARQGKEVKLEPRQVYIREFEITAVRWPEVDFRVVCSKGTYIRSLAYDLGKALNSGAYLNRLVRTRIGEFKLSDARNLMELVDEIYAERRGDEGL
ncbi:MAG: tRNA pseudouridine(55) synthase TruB [Bacteroidetes bacterium]|nr:MAG: tRNA pseudouridine(55) synthase TruB [Bacteroidota bacterium]